MEPYQDHPPIFWGRSTWKLGRTTCRVPWSIDAVGRPLRRKTQPDETLRHCPAKGKTTIRQTTIRKIASLRYQEVAQNGCCTATAPHYCRSFRSSVYITSAPPGSHRISTPFHVDLGYRHLQIAERCFDILIPMN